MTHPILRQTLGALGMLAGLAAVLVFMFEVVLPG